MTVLPYLMGRLVTANVDEETLEGNYKPIHFAFIMVTSVAIVLKFLLYFWDIKVRGGLMMSKDASAKFAAYLENKHKNKILPN
jgi:hypothetical protein